MTPGRAVVPACLREAAAFSLSSSGGEGWGEEAVSSVLSGRFVERGSFLLFQRALLVLISYLN